MTIFEVLKRFNRLDEAEHSIIYGKGFINQSHFFVGKTKNFILQTIDPKVFEEPLKALDNMDVLKRHLCENGGNKYHFCDTIVKANDGKFYTIVKDIYWCCYDLRKDEGLFKKVVNEKMAYELGFGLGEFHKFASTLDANTLINVLPQIRDIKGVFRKLENRFAKDPFSYMLPVFNQYKYLSDHVETLMKISNAIENKNIPLRVSHNNLRLNNFVMNTNDYSFVSLIGLSAIGPGTIVYDFGKAVKHFTSVLREDDQFVENQMIHLDYFTAFTKGYMEQARAFITKEELELLVDSIFAMTCLTALRHLFEYVSDDKLLECRYQDQNIDIVINQIALAKDIENKVENLKRIIFDMFNS